MLYADFTLGLLLDSKHGADVFLGFVFPFVSFLFTSDFAGVSCFACPIGEGLFWGILTYILYTGNFGTPSVMILKFLRNDLHRKYFTQIPDVKLYRLV
jgi:hypothetical protein